MKMIKKAISLIALSESEAEEQAHFFVTEIWSPFTASWMFGEFPGMRMLGLNPDNPEDKKIADAFILAIKAGEEVGVENLTDKPYKQSFGRLVKMFENNIVTKEAIDKALSAYQGNVDKNH